MRWVLLFTLLLCGCHQGPNRTQLVIQRFFGSCDAEYGHSMDVAAAKGECGTMTALLNRFQAENPDIRVVVNVVAWPGYNQLTAEIAANDPPDLVTMHQSVIADYQSRGLLEPLDRDLHRAGIEVGSFTPAARAAVQMDGRTWGLPIDTSTNLWHINLNLFRKAGLIRDGLPILPRSQAELLEQAALFRARTGKPYFVQSTVKEYSGFVRNFYTLIMQQNGPLFSQSGANFQTPQARNALALFKAVFDRNMTTKNQEYGAAVSSFLNGEGGVFPVGNWMISDFDAASHEPRHPLYDGYTVMPFPELFPERDASFADGHIWVTPRNAARPQATREAALRFMKFFADHDLDWSRTGHFPAYQLVVRSDRWREMPHRAALARVPAIASPLPRYVRRQGTLEKIVGQEAAAAISGEKSIDQALLDMEQRANAVLLNL